MDINTLEDPLNKTRDKAQVGILLYQQTNDAMWLLTKPCLSHNADETW